MRTRRVVRAPLALVTLLAAGSLVIAGSAGASHVELIVSTDQPAELIGGVYLKVPVSITCPADIAPPYTYVYEQVVDLSVTQKAGRELARGRANVVNFYDDSIFGGVPYGTPLTCDGTAHTYVVNVFPLTGSPVFHGGKAVVQLNGWINMLDPDTWYGDRTDVASGPMTLSIRG